MKTTIKRKIKLSLFFFLILVILALFFIKPWEKQPTHIHADFKVYLNDNQLNFSQPKYQERSPAVHVEDGDGDVVHIHLKGIKLVDFFNSLGIKFTDTCFALDTQESFCNNDKNKLRVYIKGYGEDWRPSFDYGNYVIKDMDRILITYGDAGKINKELGTVTNKSEKISLNPGNSTC